MTEFYSSAIELIDGAPKGRDIAKQPGVYHIEPASRLWLFLAAREMGTSEADLLGMADASYTENVIGLTRDSSGITRLHNETAHTYKIFINEEIMPVFPFPRSHAIRVIKKGTARIEDPKVPLAFAGSVDTGIGWLPKLPIGLTLLVGRGGTGKTPILRSIATYIAPIEEADRPSLKLEDLPQAIFDARAMAGFAGRPIFGVDSFRNVLRTAGGGYETGGFATGAQVFLSDVNRVAMELGISVVGVVNPNSRIIRDMSELYNMALDLDSSVAGVIISASKPTPRGINWIANLDIGLREPIGNRITKTPNTKQVQL